MGQDPRSIQREQAPTGEIYTLLQRKPVHSKDKPVSSVSSPNDRYLLTFSLKYTRKKSSYTGY